MVGVKDSVQNARYVSGIFYNEEKTCNKYSNIPANPQFEDWQGYLSIPIFQTIKVSPTLPALPPCHGCNAHRLLQCHQ